MQGTLLIAFGFLLLWVVASGRTSNLSAGWNALLGNATPTGGKSTTVGELTLPSLTPPASLSGAPADTTTIEGQTA